MSTPIGHSLLGLAVVRLIAPQTGVKPWRWYLFAAIAATAPDLDFVPGLARGDINLYHQGISHSIVAALAFGVICSIFHRALNISPFMMAFAGAMLYSSHLLLDFFRFDSRAPFGQPLFWPFSDTHWIAPVTVFKGIQHGVPGDSYSEFLGEVFSFHNLGAVGLEILVFLPMLLVVGCLTRKKWSPVGAGKQS